MFVKCNFTWQCWNQGEKRIVTVKLEENLNENVAHFIKSNIQIMLNLPLQTGFDKVR